jgi:hypothetical protein
MKEIDNFKLIKNFINFNSDDEFYFIQIIKRKKENPELKGNSRTIKTYRITSKEELENYEKEIKTLCKSLNARAYINLNKVSFKETGAKTIEVLLNKILRDDYKNFHNVYDSCAGKNNNGKEQLWLIDIDLLDNNSTVVHDIITDLIKLQKEAGHNPITEIIPTVNGIHIITRKFNRVKFLSKYNLDIHKNNPTILYYELQNLR